MRSGEFRDAGKQARRLLAAQEAQRQARRDARWSDLAHQLLATDPTLRDARQLYVRAYEVVRCHRTASLSPAECDALRDITDRVWSRGVPGGIEEAATAEADVSPLTCSASGPGSTVVVSDAEGMAARSSSPAPVAGATDEYFGLAVNLSRAQFDSLGSTSEEVGA